MTDDSSEKLNQNQGPYQMSLSYNVLNHLGLNLYSNVPAVLSEVVANAWDADAHNVSVEIDSEIEKIIITDDGHGMTEPEVNDRYLNVGYSRRDDEERGDKSDSEGRKVMGRKGIGKLSLFSIAETVEVYTKKNGDENAFRMVVEDIEEKIKSEHKEESNPRKREPYYPEVIEDFSSFPDDQDHGTHLVLTDLKKETWQAARHLRRRVARRFSIIGAEHDFEVSVDGDPITIEDRDYFHKVQYLWKIGEGADKYEEHSDPEEVHTIDGDISEYADGDFDDKLEVSGWIATAKSSDALDTQSGDINKISILMRGKLAQENIMSDINEGNVYTAYLFGELHADFLDDTGRKDAATTNREGIKKTDARYQALVDFVRDKTREIGNKWKNYRTEKGVEEARKIDAIDQWYNKLTPGKKKRAKEMFGTINEMSIDDPEEQRQLFTHSVLAFESLRQKENLDKLEHISPSNWQAISTVLGEVDEIEATLYHQIVRQRLGVIEKLKEDTDENVLEKVLQEHLYEYPWLLDPAWERATQEKRMEESLTTTFSEANDTILSDDEKAGRYDLMLMQTSGKYVLVELKRYEPTYSITQGDLVDQVEKYASALRKILVREKGMHDPNIEVICVIGEGLTNWDDEVMGSRKTNSILEQLDGRIVRYDQLIADSYAHYQEFIDEREEQIGRIESIVDGIRGEVSESTQDSMEKSKPKDPAET